MVEGRRVGEILGPGVYVLRQRGRIVYLGRAQASMLAWIHAHAANKAKEYFPPMAKPVKFDEVEIYPCPRGQVEATYAEVYARLYTPEAAEAKIAPMKRRA